MDIQKISLNEIPANTIFAVRGNLVFSKLSKQFTQEEVDMINKRSKSKYYESIKPYTVAQIENAVVIDDGDPNKKEILYAKQRLYQTSTKPGIYQFRALNKGNSLPIIYQSSKEQPKSGNQVIINKELKSGLDVTLILRIFSTKQNNGLALEGILVHDPIEYFEPQKDLYIQNGWNLTQTENPVKTEENTNENINNNVNNNQTNPVINQTETTIPVQNAGPGITYNANNPDESSWGY